MQYNCTPPLSQHGVVFNDEGQSSNRFFSFRYAPPPLLVCNLEANSQVMLRIIKSFTSLSKAALMNFVFNGNFRLGCAKSILRYHCYTLGSCPQEDFWLRYKERPPPPCRQIYKYGPLSICKITVCTQNRLK